MGHVAVIGAGVTGATTAWKLLDAGLDVTVFERNPHAALETSYANGGQLSASNAEVWNSAGTILKGMKWLFRADAPLSMSLKPSWHKYSWLAEFLAAIPSHDRNTISTARMAIAARAHLLEMARDAGISCDFEHRGILHIYDNADELAAARRVTKLLGEAGLERREVSPDEIRDIEPTIGAGNLGGFFTPSDFTGDIHKFTRQLTAAAERRGARFRYGSSVTRIRTSDTGVRIAGEIDDETFEEAFDGVVISAGCASRDLAAMAGDRVNIYPVKGYSITVGLKSQACQDAAPWVSLLDDRAKVVTSRLGADRFRIAGTAEFAGANRDIRHDRIRPLVNWCRRHFPTIDTSDVTPWAGLRPMMPNMMPRLGQGRCGRVFYNTGHGHLGWTLAAATAEATAQCVSAELH